MYILGEHSCSLISLVYLDSVLLKWKILLVSSSLLVIKCGYIENTHFCALWSVMVIWDTSRNLYFCEAFQVILKHSWFEEPLIFVQPDHFISEEPRTRRLFSQRYRADLWLTSSLPVQVFVHGDTSTHTVYEQGPGGFMNLRECICEEAVPKTALMTGW